MDFVPATGIAQFEQVFSTNGGNAENVWHVLHTDLSAWTATQLTAMCNVIQGWEQSDARFRRVAAVTHLKTLARDLSVQFGSEVTGSGSSPGTLAGAALPGNVTFAIKKESGKAGRAFRGRVYHIGCSESQQSGDTYNGVQVTGLLSTYNNLLSLVNAVSNCQLVILQSQVNKVKNNPRKGIPIIDFAAVDENLDSQRRRLTGHNIHH